MRFLFFVLPLLLSGCFVEPNRDALVYVDLTIPVPKADLAERPLYVQACIEAADLAEPVCDAFEGEAQQTEASLSITVASGSSRTLSITAFWATDQGVVSYNHYAPDLTLSPGDQTLTAELSVTPTFSLEATIAGETLPASVTPMDILTGVTFPPVAVSPQGTLQTDSLPTGRFLYLIPEGSSEPWRFCPIFLGEPGTLQKTIDPTDETC